MTDLEVKAELDALLAQFVALHRNRTNVGLAPLESEAGYAVALALRYLADVLDRSGGEGKP